MKTYSSEYKAFFYLSWIGFYIIYPAWALPISTTKRFFVFSGLVLYFSISAYLVTFFLKGLSVDKPLFISFKGWSTHIRNNLWLFVLCSIAVILHIYPITFPILIDGDEASHLQGGLGLYVYTNNYWQNFFDFPIQYIIWALTGTILFLIPIYQRNIRNIVNNLNTKFSRYESSVKFFPVFLIFGVFIAYFFLLRDLPYHKLLVREPPVAKLLYLISYLFLGISQIGPRILQIIFYVLSAIYLYRTIYLFRDKETALLGASIYLFSPLIFSFANFAELACGTIFFIILNSFYFLRFTKNMDNRDLLLTSFFIGLGFLYKREIFLMFFVCVSYLIITRIKHKGLNFFNTLKILSISLIPIIPWLIIGKLYTFRNYEIAWSHLFYFNTLISYFSMIPTQISWIIFYLFIVSVVWIFIDRQNTLSLFFGLIFSAYYLLYTADITQKIDRFSMAFYPTIAVFLSQFVADIAQRIRWQHVFKLFSLSLTFYLMLISTIWQMPSLKAEFVTYKNIESRYFPVDEAMKWVKDNVKEGEKILILRVAPSVFYRDKYGINRDRIVDFWYDLEGFSTPQKLKTFYKNNAISYIMFSYGPAYPTDKKTEILEYLRENPEREFIEVTRFNLDKNYIFVYKID